MDTQQKLPLLIDSHTHLCDRNISAAAVIADMKKDGLEKLITVGYDYQSSKYNVLLASQNKEVYATVGIHPSDSKRAKSSDYSGIYDLAKEKKVVAIGEIGLDYHYEDTDKAAQKNALLTQLDIAQQFGLPVVIHLRDAYDDMNKIVHDNFHKFSAPAILHCFSGSKETAIGYAAMGFYISFSGVITYKDAKKYADIIRALPKSKLLVETDCPYLTPEPYRGKTNLPCYVREVSNKMAEILGISNQEMADITRRNTINAFMGMR